MVAFTGDIYFGLWYPVIFAALSVVIGGLFLREQPVEEESPGLHGAPGRA